MLKKLGADYAHQLPRGRGLGPDGGGLTPGGAGADHIIEVGGEHTMGQSLAAVKYGGVISLIGFLGGAQPKESILSALNSICTLRGIFVGSRQQMRGCARPSRPTTLSLLSTRRCFPRPREGGVRVHGML